MDGVNQPLQPGYQLVIVQPKLTSRHLPVFQHIGVLHNYQADAAPGPGRVVLQVPLGDLARIRGHFGGHGRHHQPVFEVETLYLNAIEKSWHGFPSVNKYGS